MEYLALKGYEMVAVMAPFAVCYAPVMGAYRRRGIKNVGLNTFLCFVFALYIFGVLLVTGTGTLYDVLRQGLNVQQGQVN